jgi:pyruvate kinase
MSHGDHDQHKKSVRLIRKISKETSTHVGILMDLCGPKIRVGKFVNDQITLKANAEVLISCIEKIGDEGVIVSQYKDLYKDVKKGERILLDDGNFELSVKQVKDKAVICKVVYGGILKENKGMNLPDSNVGVSSFTAKDKKDAVLAVEVGADFLALSFVRSADDIDALKKFLKNKKFEIPIIAKIEKPEAIDNINEILKVSYGIMIARGDLGIELPAEKVPLIQRDLINKARYYHRPVIVATQMMESMITNARPTRAEVGDVANAALLSADAVMLSAETASGKYPIKAVQTMDCVLREIEVYQWQKNSFGERIADEEGDPMPSDRKAVAHAVYALAKDLKLQGILVPTRTGTTAKVLSANRPTSPLLGVCSDERVCCRLSLHWGVISFHVKEKETHDWKVLCKSISKQCHLSRTGNTVLFVSGFSHDPALSEPVLKLMHIRD